MMAAIDIPDTLSSGGGSPQPHKELVDKLQGLLTDMAQNVTTVECLISSIATDKDRQEVNEKMKETSQKLEELLPLMQTYMGLPEPEEAGAKEKWWMQRERMNRELEAFLHNFQLLYAILGSKLSGLPGDSLVEVLKSELKNADAKLPRFQDEISDIVSQAEQTLIVIVSEMDEKTPKQASQAQEPKTGTENKPQDTPKQVVSDNDQSDTEDQSSASSPDKDGKRRKKRRPSACRQS